MSKLKGKTMFNSVYITLNTEQKKGSIILIDDVSSTEGKLYPYQEVVLTGNKCEVVKPGDVVLVDFNAFMKPVRNNKSNMENQVPETTYELALPIVEVNGVSYGHIREAHILYVYDESEIPKKKKETKVKA